MCFFHVYSKIHRIGLPCCILVDFAIDLDAVVVRCSLPATDALVGGLLEELSVDRISRELYFRCGNAGQGVKKRVRLAFEKTEVSAFTSVLTFGGQLT